MSTKSGLPSLSLSGKLHTKMALNVTMIQYFLKDKSVFKSCVHQSGEDEK